MNDMKLFARAVAFAAEKHANQVRKDGSPYIYHPVEVARLLRDGGYDLKYQTAAVLHDVLEDTDATEDDVRTFGEDILEAVKAVTRPNGADEADYVESILKNDMAKAVKTADKMHNLWDCVHSLKYEKKRTYEDVEFARQYIEKAKKYYRGRFGRELDLAIADADAEMNRDIEINQEDEIVVIAEKLGCREELVEQYLDAEYEYLLAHGFIIESCEEYPETPETANTGEKLDLDIDDMVDYIVERTGMDEEQVNQIVDAEYEYEYELGIAGEKTYND